MTCRKGHARESIRDVMHRQEFGRVEPVVVLPLELVRRVVDAYHLGVHVVIGELRRDPQHYRIVSVKNVIDNVQRADASIGEHDVSALDVDLVLPEFTDGIVQRLTVRIRPHPDRMEVLQPFSASRRNSVRIAALAAVDSAFRKFDLIHRVADLFLLEQFFSDLHGCFPFVLISKHSADVPILPALRCGRYRSILILFTLKSHQKEPSDCTKIGTRRGKEAASRESRADLVSCTDGAAAEQLRMQ